ncbi:potassium transporter [Lactobacillus sp. S2-2]|uniref:cation:proton antiporter family protein n=1 Tax=Lactobacillus sp. S2-2 TaxID=2692917 RepID=UPI001F013608|nr:cation:proton antiporter family protein [Lactobacillus sp. S2-2]MCF6514736.1 potassium transporter [Lactobacillus sp. S2-2]
MSQVSLLIILTAALLTPLILARFKISILPTAVVEIIVGVILGPSLLNIVNSSSLLHTLSQIGVTVLLFLSGMEINFDLLKFKNRNPSKLDQKKSKNNSKYSPLKLALLSYTSIIMISILLAVFCKITGLFSDLPLASILFMTVSLGIVIATLKEKELLKTDFGQTILLISALGEVIPVIGLTFYISIYGTNSKSLWLLLILIVIAGLLIWNFKDFFYKLSNFNKSTTQIDVRLAFFITVLLSTTAVSVGSESVLGAFIAGMVYKLLKPSESTMDRLNSIGYGLFIPVFFIMSGVDLNIKEILSDPKTIVLIPIFLLSYLISKLGLYPILKLRFSKRNAIAATALPSTTITMVLAILQVAKEMNVITSQQSGAFLLAAILTCLIGPLVFNRSFKSAKEVYPKTKLNFFGVNISSFPVYQQLSNDWYDINLYTDKKDNFSAYNSQSNVYFIENNQIDNLIDNGYFDCDIAVFSYFDSNKNYQLAKEAKKYGVKRVITRFEDRNIINDKQDELLDEGIEVYNTFSTNIAMLRELIQVPSTFKMITSNSIDLHEVTLKNSRYSGFQISELPFVDWITINEIFRNHKYIHPAGNTKLELGDKIIFSCDNEKAATLKHEISQLN